jgi:hypothetical protein
MTAAAAVLGGQDWPVRMGTLCLVAALAALVTTTEAWRRFATRERAAAGAGEGPGKGPLVLCTAIVLSAWVRTPFLEVALAAAWDLVVSAADRHALWGSVRYGHLWTGLGAVGFGTVLAVVARKEWTAGAARAATSVATLGGLAAVCELLGAPRDRVATLMVSAVLLGGLAHCFVASEERSESCARRTVRNTLLFLLGFSALAPTLAASLAAPGWTRWDTGAQWVAVLGSYLLAAHLSLAIALRPAGARFLWLDGWLCFHFLFLLVHGWRLGGLIAPGRLAMHPDVFLGQTFLTTLLYVVSRGVLFAGAGSKANEARASFGGVVAGYGLFAAVNFGLVTNRNGLAGFTSVGSCWVALKAAGIAAQFLVAGVAGKTLCYASLTTAAASISLASMGVGGALLVAAPWATSSLPESLRTLLRQLDPGLLRHWNHVSFPALPGAAIGLGLGAAILWLLRRGADGRGRSPILEAPVGLLESHQRTLNYAVSLLLAAALAPAALDLLSRLSGGTGLWYGVFDEAVLYYGLLLGATVVGAVFGRGQTPGLVAGGALALGAGAIAARLGAGAPPHGVAALSAAAMVAMAALLPELARWIPARFLPGEGREIPDTCRVVRGLRLASVLAVPVAFLELLPATDLPRPDGWAGLATLVPTAAAAHLLRLAVRHSREDLVYAAEAAAAASFLYLKVTGILGTTIWGQVAIQLVAFALLAIAGKVRGGRYTILARPLDRTSRVFPILLLLRAVLLPGTVDWKGFDGLGPLGLGLMASAFYALVAEQDRRARWRVLAGVCGYAGLCMLLLRRYGRTDPWAHLDLYLVPFGLLVVAFSRMERGNLLEEQERRLRAVGLLLIYVSPVVHAVISGTPSEVLLLLGLGVVGVVVGVVARVQLFTLYGGVSLATGTAVFLLRIVAVALTTFAFLVCTTLAVAFGGYSYWARSRRAELGL